MIRIPSQIKRLPTKTEINKIIEFIGYNGYIPYSIIIDIYQLLIHDFHETEAYDVSNDYLELLEDIILHVNSHDNYDFLHVACVVFKGLRTKINFRKVESNKIDIKIDKTESQQNYNIDISNFSDKTLELLDVVKEEDENTIILSDKVQEVLEFQNGVRPSIGTSLSREVIVKEKMTNFSQIGRARKYKYCLPSWTVDVALKKLDVKTRKEEDTQYDRAVVMIDRSLSTGGDGTYRHLVKAVLLEFLNQFTLDFNSLTVIEFTNKITHTHKMNFYHELQDYIKKELPPMISSINYANGFKALNKYQGQTIHLLTDGIGDFTRELTKKVKWTVLSLNSNSKLSALALNTGGQFIKM